MRSWGKFLPDYRIMRWDESTFDIKSSIFTEQAYENKKWAFVADYVRLWALREYGGIYLDTDVEIVRPIDNLLSYNAFGGYETDNVIQTGIIGSVRDGRFINMMFDYYKNLPFVTADGNLNQEPNSAIFARILSAAGISTCNERSSSELIEMFPSQYFCPINQATWEIRPTPETYCIHYLSGSWLPSKDRFSRRLKSLIGRTFGFGIVTRLRSIFRKVYK